MNPVTLRNQRRYTEKSSLTLAELKCIANKPEEDVRPTNEAPSTKTTEETESENQPNGTKDDKLNVEILDLLTVTFEKYRHTDLSERKKPRKYQSSKVNTEKLEDMSYALKTILLSHRDIDLSNLNTLYYPAAIVLAGTNGPNPNSKYTKMDPYASIKTQIEEVRKWIGKLTAAK